MWKRVLAGMTLLILISCSTPYQKTGVTGGVSEYHLKNDVYMLVSVGNGYTSFHTVERHFYKRAREIAEERGFESYNLRKVDKKEYGKPSMKGEVHLYGKTALLVKTKPKPVRPIKVIKPSINAKKPLRFSPGPKKPDDIAVVIGNSNYKKLGRDIPNVTPAYADAEAFKKWVEIEKGVLPGNIIHLTDVTSGQLVELFGNEKSHKGRVFNWLKKSSSNIYIYYSGHGSPSGAESKASLIPSDSSSSSIDLTGYKLETLYRNLARLKAKSITVVLEACFSGSSQAGNVISRTSGLNLEAKIPHAPNRITVISAGSADQVASWEKDGSASLFTKYFLKGMAGEADKLPYGNNDNHVSYSELEEYLGHTVTYFARKYYGRDQVAQFNTSLM
jgi:hypothetical protein